VVTIPCSALDHAEYRRPERGFAIAGGAEFIAPASDGTIDDAEGAGR
jgi:hypothetical protein